MDMLISVDYLSTQLTLYVSSYFLEVQDRALDFVQRQFYALLHTELRMIRKNIITATLLNKSSMDILAF